MLLTVPRNDTPFHIPEALLGALRADLALPQHVPRAPPPASGESPRVMEESERLEAGTAPQSRRTWSMRSTRSGIGPAMDSSVRSVRSLKSLDDGGGSMGTA